MTTNTALATAPQTEQKRLAIINEAGEVIVIGPSLPVLTLEDAEAAFVVAKETQDALKRFVEFVEGVIIEGWKKKAQVEGILGGRRYERKSKPGTYVYQDAELFTALKPFVGKVITEDERIEALGWDYQPTRIVPAVVVPEIVSYAPKTATLDSFCKRGEEIAKVIQAHRSREMGPEKLVAK